MASGQYRGHGRRLELSPRQRHDGPDHGEFQCRRAARSVRRLVGAARQFGGTGGTYGTLTFQAKVLDKYTNTASGDFIRETDPVHDSVTASGDLRNIAGTPTGNTISDTSQVTDVVPQGQDQSGDFGDQRRRRHRREQCGGPSGRCGDLPARIPAHLGRFQQSRARGLSAPSRSSRRPIRPIPTPRRFPPATPIRRMPAAASRVASPASMPGRQCRQSALCVAHQRNRHRHGDERQCRPTGEQRDVQSRAAGQHEQFGGHSRRVFHRHGIQQAVRQGSVPDRAEPGRLLARGVAQLRGPTPSRWHISPSRF